MRRLTLTFSARIHKICVYMPYSDQNARYVNMGRLLDEPVHDISNNVVCATSKASDQPAHMRSLIRAFASRLSIL